jgi:hypothetical protein
MGYCLYGGTVLALRYGHRRSIDFDFFSDRNLDRIALDAALPLLKEAEILQSAAQTLVVLAVPPGSRHGVKISFFGGIKFGRVGIPELSDDSVILSASVRDLLATKLKTLFDRVEPKDYLDIAEILNAGEKLSQGLADARTLFGSSFPPAECLRILSWFEEPELASLPARCRKTLEDAVRASWDRPLLFSKIASRSLSLPTRIG